MGSHRNYYKRGISYLKRNGLKSAAYKAAERIFRDRNEKGYRPFHADETELARQREHVFDHPYMFSILVPVYETAPDVFRAMLESVAAQTYGNWELILADASRDDSRRGIVRRFTEEHRTDRKDRFGNIEDKVRYIRIEENKGISANTNAALEAAKGDYTGLLDHDDVLENTALFDIMSAIEEAEKSGQGDDVITRVAAVYTDEDKISADGGTYFDPHIKGGFDPVLLCTNNYICHFFVADTNLARSVGGFRSEYDGAQDHDFILRCTEGRRQGIIHVPKVLYHWRSTPGSTSENPDAKLYAYEAGKRAVSDHLRRTGTGAKVTDSPHLGFFVIEYDRLHRSVICVTPDELSEKAAGPEEFILVLSPSLKPLDGDYIADMMSCMQLENVGAVTGRIIGSGNRIESAGYGADENGNIIPCFAGLYRRFSGYMHRADLDRLSKGFAPDCVLLRKDAVQRYAPKIELKDGYDIYYKPVATFKRSGK